MSKGRRAAAYCRVSHDDGDSAEHESIANQRRIIEDYCARRPELDLVACYADDGFTGTNFDRPDFKRMLSDIEAGRIDCVVVKDLSRFGRDYIDMGRYLERWFPAHGVRFIAVGEGVDSARGAYDMMLPLRNVFNAQYARDTSDKVRRTFRAKQQRGEFIGAFAPYGYAKDPGRRNHLVVDEEAAAVVRRIYDLYARGMSFGAIARALNREGVPSPLAYKRQHGERLYVGQTAENTRWSSTTVGTILRSEVYRGSTVSNRFPTGQMHGKTRRAPRSEWIVVEGTHAPVVTAEQWAAVQARLPAAKPAAAAAPSLFRGLLRCGGCGGAMKRHGGRYCCLARRNCGPAACTGRSISEAMLTSLVLEDLNRVIARSRMLDAPLPTAPEPSGQDGEQESVAAVERLERLKRNAYEDYRGGVLAREEFARRKAEYDEQARALRARRVLRPAAARESAGPSAWVKRLLTLGRLTELDRATLEQTVERVCVFADGRLELVYRFSAAALSDGA